MQGSNNILQNTLSTMIAADASWLCGFMMVPTSNLPAATVRMQ